MGYFFKLSNTFKIISELPNKPSFESIIGMGVYAGDRAEWVEHSIQSMVNQTYKNVLFVIIIDGEIPLSLRALLVRKDEEHNNVLLIQSRNNVGLSKCMNYVVDWALENIVQAEFFFRMDADDISVKDRLAKQVMFLKANPNISILGSGLTEINEKGEKVGQRKLPLKHHEIMRFLPKRCSINHPTVAIRFSVFEQGFRYRNGLKNTQDYFFWADLAAAGFKFANLPDKLLQFRRVNDFYKRRGYSKSLNEFKARFYTMKVLKRYGVGNTVYACGVLILRLMPAKLVKLAYKIDRYLLNKRVKHE
jgi:glycosyltransferase involved in cell wall biosynthesis